MKKAMILLLSVLVALNVFVSCDNDQKIDNEPTKMVQFNDGRGMAKALNRAPEALDTEALWWSYTAEKVDSSGFTTGQTSDKLPVGEKGLTASVGPFSQGAWKFTLYGYTDSTRTKLAWTGSAEAKLTVKNGVSAPASVSVDVHRLRTPGVNGIIRVPSDLKVHDKDGSVVGTTYNLDVKIYKGDVLQKFEAHSSNDYEVESGLYKVVVTAVSEDGTIEYATNEIAVNVYDNLVTTVGGFLDEATLNTQFSTNEKGETVATGSVTPVSKTAEPTVLEVASTPAETHSTESAPTSVSIPQNSITGENATLSVIPYKKEAVTEKPEFTFEGEQQGMSGVGGVDLNLTVDGKDVTSFNGQTVTVTTYIDKGLSPKPIVKYNGDGEDPDPDKTTYDAETGKLTFETTHFSKFLIFVSVPTPKAKIVDKEYTSLGAAITAATDGQTITLLDDIVFALPKTIDKNVTIDMNSHSISLLPDTELTVNNGTFIVANEVDPTSQINGSREIFNLEAGSLVINGGTYKTKNNNVYDTESSPEPYSLIKVTGNAKVTINNGTFSSPIECITNANIPVITPIIYLAPSEGCNSVEIVNGNFTGLALLHSAPNGVASIANGVFESISTVVYQKAGELTVSGGTFTCDPDKLAHNANRVNTYETYYEPDVASTVYIPLFVESLNENMKITVTGGTFTGYKWSKEDAFMEKLFGPTMDIFILDFVKANGEGVIRADVSGMKLPYYFVELGFNDPNAGESDGIGYGNAVRIDPVSGSETASWNGFMRTDKWYDASASEFHIRMAGDFGGFADLINKGTTFEGQTVYLDYDIDLLNNIWPSNHSSGTFGITGEFKGTFDGQNHKIKGVNLNGCETAAEAVFGNMTTVNVTCEAYVAPEVQQ